MMKLIWLDDNSDIFETYLPWFKSFGYDIKTSSSVSKALKELDEFQYDILLLDLKMHGNLEEGYELIETINKLSDVNIVLFSNYIDKKRGEELVDVKQIVGFIEKPLINKRSILLFFDELEKLRKTIKVDKRYKKYEIESKLRQVHNEKQYQRKGKYLEDLMGLLFQSINGFEIHHNEKTATEEIDLVILNNSKDPFWTKESALILVECKNWTSKVGKNQIVIFEDKLENRNQRAKLGYFIAWEGFTKTFKLQSIRKSESDKLIIPISGKEIEESINTNSFETLLKKKWFEIVLE